VIKGQYSTCGVILTPGTNQSVTWLSLIAVMQRVHSVAACLPAQKCCLLMCCHHCPLHQTPSGLQYTCACEELVCYWLQWHGYKLHQGGFCRAQFLPTACALPRMRVFICWCTSSAPSTRQKQSIYLHSLSSLSPWVPSCSSQGRPLIKLPMCRLLLVKQLWNIHLTKNWRHVSIAGASIQQIVPWW